jgi:hypothetical protein
MTHTGENTMKMAKASEADMDCATEIARIIGDIEKGYMPSDPDNHPDEFDFFHDDDAEQCQKVVEMLLKAARKGSLFRVVFGMACCMHPSNRLLDPDADTLEKHPEIIAALSVVKNPICSTGTST